MRPLRGSYFAKRFTACLTLREKDVGITQVYERFLRLALLYIERWIKDRRDLTLHQMRILPSECKCSEQWRGIEALYCLYSPSFFLSHCWIRVIPQANPLLEAELSGVNHLVNSSLYFLNARICHQRCSLWSDQPGRLVVRLTEINYSCLRSLIMWIWCKTHSPVFNNTNWLD